MLHKYLEKLEYPKILQQVSNYCHTYLGREYILTFVPSFSKEQVQVLLDQTLEAENLSYRKGIPPLVEIPNISLWLKLLESSQTLSSKAILETAHILKVSRELKQYFIEDTELDTSAFPYLTTIFSSLYTNKKIEDSIFNAILSEDNIADDASDKLFSLRKSHQKIERDIREKLNYFIHSSNHAKYLMDPIITIRNDRFVLPVKEEYKDAISGFIHDTSASGSTVYIEPSAILELNNKLNRIKVEEEIEIEIILQKLSSLFFPIIQELENNLTMIQTLDILFAKAAYGKNVQGIIPTLGEKKQIVLTKARHPLINPNIVVPIDITLGKDFSTLIITGPNTGGKTVTLKTMGLLLLMAYSGIPIPVDSRSQIYVLDGIYADIGDEQSIQESLSTFSSHMLNIIEILNSATCQSLVLLDELGSGTDPIEGASLAISILEHFHSMGCLTLATTHYSELKNYALVTDGFENASSDFDIEHLKPTYQLLIGVPGQSNAFAISKKLGLSNVIIQRASNFLQKDHMSVEELLKNIYQDKLEIEKEKQKIEQNSHQIELLRKSLEKQNSLLLETENEKIADAKLKAREILLNAKEEANELIKELNDMISSHSKEDLAKANQLRTSLNEQIASLTKKDINPHTVVSTTPLALNDTVRVTTLNQIGTIKKLENKSGEVQVQIGNMVMNVPVSNIEKVSSSQNKGKDYSSSSRSHSLKAKSISTEINVIGQNVDEATFVIDKYLDDCYLSNLKTVRIVHGKGTGKLREGIHLFLKKHPHVKSFRLGTFGEGEMGVTIVELK